MDGTKLNFKEYATPRSLLSDVKTPLTQDLKQQRPLDNKEHSLEEAGS